MVKWQKDEEVERVCSCSRNGRFLLLSGGGVSWLRCHILHISVWCWCWMLDDVYPYTLTFTCADCSSWNDYVRKSHCRKCGHVYCAACLEEVVRDVQARASMSRNGQVIPGYGKKIMDKYYMKQKACQKCRDEVATMPPPPPPPPPGSAEEEELGRQQDGACIRDASRGITWAS